MRTARSAFLLEIDEADATEVGTIRGHVEHVLSGRAIDFRSWTTLRAFLLQIAVPEPAPTLEDAWNHSACDANEETP